MMQMDVDPRAAAGLAHAVAHPSAAEAASAATASSESETETEADITTLQESRDRDPAYFGYYAQFVHQQNMLTDMVRTSIYHNSILLNSAEMFKDRVVADVGAGSWILSYFAAIAGASKVYAIEASGMATVS